jgi:hypothetical protein
MSLVLAKGSVCAVLPTVILELRLRLAACCGKGPSGSSSCWSIRVGAETRACSMRAAAAAAPAAVAGVQCPMPAVDLVIA